MAVTVTIESNIRRENLPSGDELRRLMELVERAHPKLCPDANEAREYFTHFRNAAMFLICSARRSETIDTRYSAWTFMNNADRWLGENRINGGVGFKALTAAAIATAVPYAGEYPFVSFALSLGAAGRASAEWREILSRGHVPAPVVVNDGRPRDLPEFRVRRPALPDVGERLRR